MAERFTSDFPSAVFMRQGKLVRVTYVMLGLLGRHFALSVGRRNW
jgi:hypothetical protein